ncbi:HNH endonuclease [Actinokineospora sp.]|uniref:HNH endonuclease n=1 Tax=Actinokineospora sp. TaxID=1872133 RepID=UPI004037A62F
MIPIVRPELAPSVTSRLAEFTARIAAAPHPQASVARTLWRASGPTRDVIRQTLAAMAPGRQFCMYCGDNLGTDIDHFDPLSRAPMRTFDWLNHLLACSFCNSHCKRDVFPLDEHGRPLLVDPTSEDPFDHLVLALSVGEYRPRNGCVKGSTTIDVFGLNRPLLVRGRLDARYVVGLILRDWRRARDRRDEPAMAAALRSIREQSCADVCQAMVRQASSPRARVVFGRDYDLVELLCTPQLRTALIG